MSQMQHAAGPIPGGDGSHVVAFLYWPEDPEPFGLVERHTGAGGCHGGYIAWRSPGEPYVARHTLVAGGPQDLGALSITPSLVCIQDGCGSHGWITDGCWKDA